MKKVLVLGGTGAIGTYLVPKLADRGYDVTVVSLDDIPCGRPNLHFHKANALDKAVVTALLAEHFDGVIDLMIYSEKPFSSFADLYLPNTEHYIYLSSYRVFADKEHPVVESSPQLLDTAQDPVYLASNDYSLHKARGERILRTGKYKNWTIVRPAITYSKKTLPANHSGKAAFAAIFPLRRNPAFTGTGTEKAGNDELGRRCCRNAQPPAFLRTGSRGRL